MWRKSAFWPNSKITRTKFQRIYWITCSANLLKVHKQSKKSLSLRSITTLMEGENGTYRWKEKRKTSPQIRHWKMLFQTRSQTTTFWVILSDSYTKTSSITRIGTNPQKNLDKNQSQSPSMCFHCWGWSLLENIWLLRSSAKDIISRW